MASVSKAGGRSVRLRYVLAAAAVVVAAGAVLLVMSVRTDARDCAQARTEDIDSTWQQYLNRHPFGECADHARRRIDSLKHFRWVQVPAGTFQMGGPDINVLHKTDEVAHRVTLTRNFRILATEVTRDQWQYVLGTELAQSRFPDCGADCPVDSVTWYDALAFCNALSQQEGYDPCYVLHDCEGVPGNRLRCRRFEFLGLECRGYRLPTEAEWEYAALGGTDDIHPFGNGCPQSSKVNYDGREAYLDCPKGEFRNGPVPAGSLAGGANAWDIHDLAGNMAEWVWDAYGELPATEATDPVGATEGSRRVYRGGSWNSGGRELRCSNRESAMPVQTLDYVGFRPVRSIP